MSPITQLVTDLLDGMVRHPDDLTVTEEIFDALPEQGIRGEIELFVSPHRADYGVINGKMGRQVTAFKSLLLYAAEKFGMDGKFTLLQPGTGKPEPKRKFVQDPDFDGNAFLKIAQRVASAMFEFQTRVDFLRTNDRVTLTIAIVGDPDQRDAKLTTIADLLYPYAWSKGAICEVVVAKRTIEPSKENVPQKLHQ